MNQYGLWGSRCLEAGSLKQPGVGMLSAGCLHSQEDPLPPLPSVSPSSCSSFPSLQHATQEPVSCLPPNPAWHPPCSQLAEKGSISC